MVNHLRRLTGAINCRLGRHDDVRRSHYNAAESDLLLVFHYPGSVCRRCSRFSDVELPEAHPEGLPWPCNCARNPVAAEAIRAARLSRKA